FLSCTVLHDPVLSRLFFSASSRHHPDLHSFPTRRSSDLRPGTAVHREQRGLHRPAVHRQRDPLLGQPRHPRRRIDRPDPDGAPADRKSTRLNSSHVKISYAVFCLKKKKRKKHTSRT